MAGFFGLFDYSKPGPGVEKNAPKKKAFVVFFEIYFRKFWKLICANLLFVLVSLPLLTTGLANAGLTYITRNFAREKHAFISGDFFDTIKKNWKQALPAGIINLVITVILAFDIWFFYTAGNGLLNTIMLAVILMIALLITFMKYYMYMLMITFKLSLKQIYKNSFIFAFTGLFRNLLLAICFGVFYAIAILGFIYLTPIAIPVIILFYVFLFPAFRSMLIQFAVFPLVKKLMIDPYYRDHPDEDKEAKAALNLQDESDETDDEERVFEDTLPDKDEDEVQKKTFPRQYSEQEMNRLRKHQKRHHDDDGDDDGTI